MITVGLLIGAFFIGFIGLAAFVTGWSRDTVPDAIAGLALMTISCYPLAMAFKLNGAF